jgi:8-oxo-dGTP diphosphatase
VHRPHRDDWSLPKGKLDTGEHPLVAAVREVVEETGFRGVPQLRLPQMEYVLPDGRPKVVDFWLMRASDGPAGEIADPDEIDALDWLPLPEAAARLSYPTDRALLERVATLPPITAITPMVRHAHAGDRKKWTGNDALRPIDPQGQVVAEQLAVVLALFEPRRLIAATPLRCKQTLQPLADRLDLPIIADAAFAEPSDLHEVPAKVKIAVARLAELRDDGMTTVIGSQGKVMPPLLALLESTDDPTPYKTPKGGGWLLSWSGADLAGLSRL